MLYLDTMHAPVSNECFLANVWYSLQDSNGHYVVGGEESERETTGQRVGGSGDEGMLHLCGLLRK